MFLVAALPRYAISSMNESNPPTHFLLASSLTYRKNKVSEFSGDTSRKATAGSAALQGGSFCPKGILSKRREK